MIKKVLSLFTILLLITGCNKNDLKFVKNVKVNDSLLGEGYLKNSLKVGNWKYFDKNNNLVAVNEYKIINNGTYLNQEIVFNKNGDTIFDKSHFYTYSTRVNDKKERFLSIKYKRIFEGDSYLMFVYNKDLKSDFSNLNDLKLDTLLFENNTLEIQYPKKSEIRGVINEIKFLSDSVFDTRKVYIEISESSSVK